MHRKNEYPMLILVIMILIFADPASGDKKSSYIAQGNNVELFVQTGPGGPLAGKHRFPRGSVNTFETSCWNWGIMAVRDLNNDGVREDTSGPGENGGRIRGMNSSLESYAEVEALVASGSNMFQVSTGVDHNSIQSSIDGEDLFEWYPEFRQNRDRRGAPILLGLETVALRCGDAFNENEIALGVSMEYRFHFLPGPVNSNMIFGHVFIRNLSEYLKWNPDTGMRQRVANTPNGQTWGEMTFYYAVAGGLIGSQDESWAFYNPKAIHVIADRNGIESTFTKPVFMVAHELLRAPSLRGETMQTTNLIEYNGRCEFGFCGSKNVLANGYSSSEAFKISKGKGFSDYIWPGVISPWNGKQIHGWPGLLDTGDARYRQWIWGEQNAYNHYQFWGSLHNFSPRDSTSADFVIMFVNPANPPFTLPNSNPANIDDANVQAQLAPVLDYSNTAHNAFANFKNWLSGPEAPTSPTLTTKFGTGQVTISWSDVSQLPDNYYSFLQQNPEFDPNGQYRQYDFEGYRVYRSTTGNTADAKLIAQFDLADGIILQTGISPNGDTLGISSYDPVTGSSCGLGKDTGLTLSFVDRDLVQNVSYYYGVTAYDWNSITSGDMNIMFSLESPLSFNEKNNIGAIWFTCGSDTVSPGSTANVSISINNYIVAISGGQFVITPNSSKNYVTFKEATTTSRTSGWAVSHSASRNGELIIFYSGSGGSISPGSGEILTLTYEISTDAPAGVSYKITLDLSGVKISDENQQSINVTFLVNGSFTIGGCQLAGDVTNDGVVDIFDILTMVRFILGQQTLTSLQKSCADINADGEIDIFDVLACLKKVLGKDVQLAAYKDFDPSQINIQQLKTDLSALCADQSLIEDILSLLPQHSHALPKAFSLSQNTPNPFNPSTTINYSVPEGASVIVSLKVYDIRGRLVRTLADGSREPGTHTVLWDGTDESGQQASSGIYIYRLRAGDFVQTRKMVLLK